MSGLKSFLFIIICFFIISTAVPAHAESESEINLGIDISSSQWNIANSISGDSSSIAATAGLKIFFNALKDGDSPRALREFKQHPPVFTASFTQAKYEDNATSGAYFYEVDESTATMGVKYYTDSPRYATGVAVDVSQIMFTGITNTDMVNSISYKGRGFAYSVSAEQYVNQNFKLYLALNYKETDNSNSYYSIDERSTELGASGIILNKIWLSGYYAKGVRDHSAFEHIIYCYYTTRVNFETGYFLGSSLALYAGVTMEELTSEGLGYADDISYATLYGRAIFSPNKNIDINLSGHYKETEETINGSVYATDEELGFSGNLSYRF